MSTTRKRRSFRKRKTLRKRYLWAHKRPWLVSYRDNNREKITVILPNGTMKNKLLREVDANNFYVYGISNLTDGQIAYYERNGQL
jgi:hypothetical protein